MNGLGVAPPVNKRAAPLVAVLLLATTLTGCIASDRDPVDVVTTIYPMTFLVEHLVGPDLSVRALVDPGQEPHAWEPTIRDVRELAEARLVVAQGAGMEPWLDRLLDSIGEEAPDVVVSSAGLHLLEAGEHADHADEHQDEHANHANESDDHAHAPTEQDPAAAGGTPSPSADPHTWLDPALFGEQLRVVSAALQQHFPEHAAAIADREDAMARELDLLHQEYTATLMDCEHRFIVVNHNAFAYLARQYDLTVEAVHGLSPEGEPAPSVVQRLVELTREHNVSVVFFEDLASPRTIEVIARETGAEARVLHPVGSRTADQVAAGADYLSLMRTNLDHLAEAMRCL